jgi:hypothetical protein
MAIFILRVHLLYFHGDYLLYFAVICCIIHIPRCIFRNSKASTGLHIFTAIESTKRCFRKKAYRRAFDAGRQVLEGKAPEKAPKWHQFEHR